MLKKNSYTVWLPDGTDLNTFIGPYKMTARGTGYDNIILNSPYSGAYVVEWIPYDSESNYGVQIAYAVQQSSNGYYIIMKRVRENGQWNAWEKSTAEIENQLEKPSAEKLSTRWIIGQKIEGWGLICMIPANYPFPINVVSAQVFAGSSWSDITLTDIAYVGNAYWANFYNTPSSCEDGKAYLVAIVCNGS